jgi:hypothetical protein
LELKCCDFSTSFSAGTTYLASGMASGGVLSVSINGGTMATGSATFSGTGTFTVGAGYTDNRAKYSGAINEAIVFNSALTTSQRQQVEGYLAQKWGLQANLPATHPYYATSTTQLYKRPVFQRTFGPQDIQGCAMWFDAADTATLTFSGSTVTQWADKSGNGYNATNGTYVAPTYSASGFNGKYPALLFNGSSTMLNTPAILPTPVLSLNGTDTTLFLVFNYVFTGTNYGAYGLGTNNNTYVLRTPWNTGSFGTAIIDTAGSATGSRILYTFGGAQAAAQLYTITRSGASHYFYQFGSLTASNLSATGTVGTTSQTFGIGGGVGDAVYFNSYISELIIYNYALSSIQRQQVEQYLGWKWGLISSLASGHSW